MKLKSIDVYYSYHPEGKYGQTDGWKDGWTDRHTDVQCETIIPSHYHVAGIKIIT